jgi:hypothetical protein
MLELDLPSELCWDACASNYSEIDGSFFVVRERDFHFCVVCDISKNAA